MNKEAFTNKLSKRCMWYAAELEVELEAHELPQYIPFVQDGMSRWWPEEVITMMREADAYLATLHTAVDVSVKNIPSFLLKDHHGD